MAKKTAQELEAMFDTSPERTEEIDRDACSGKLHGHAVRTSTGPGRPPISDEPMVQVSFKETASILS